MNRKHNVLILTAFLLSTLFASAQVGSPYSQYGVGDLNRVGFGQSQAMGGIGIGLRTNQHINVLNPAAYSALDSNSVIYELGLSGGFNTVETTNASDFKTDGNIDYFALGFRAARRWHTGLGLMKVTNIDYLLKSDNSNNYNGLIDTYYYGDGGTYKFYWTNSFAVTEELSLGVSINYNFGAINRVKTIIFYEDSGADNTKYDEQTNLYGFTFDYGAQYTLPLKNSWDLTLGLTYSNQMKVNKKSNIMAGTLYNTSYGEIVLEDVIAGVLIDTVINIEDEKSKTKLPQKIGGGFTLSKKNKLIVGADINFQNWSNFELDSFDEALNDQFSIHAGMEYTPDYKSMTSYLKRTHYRLGGHFNQSHITIGSQRINDYGISFGVGLPLRRTNTSFNVSFELGQRGTTEQNLVKETYGVVSLNLSLSDIWFLKRKYN